MPKSDCYPRPIVLATLEETFDAVESSVFSLEDMIEEAELKRKKVHHHCQLALYKERKDVELEQIKGMLHRYVSI